MKLGSNLQFLRKLHGGMTQEKLAERMGVSRQTVSKWETGEALPDLEKLLQLSRPKRRNRSRRRPPLQAPRKRRPMPRLE